MAVSIAACGSNPATTNNGSLPAGDIKIGLLVPLSGPLAAAGKSIKDSYNAGANLLNQQGGIEGHQIQIIAINDQGDPAIAVASAKQLVSQGVIFEDYVGFSSTIDQTIPIFDKAQIPMIDEDQSDVYHDPKTYPYFFSPLQSDSAMMQMEAEAARALGKTKVVILNDTTPISQNWVAEFKAYAQEAGITVADTITYPVTSVDVSTQVQQAKATGADTVMVLADAALSNVYSAMDTIGWKPTVLDSVFTPAEGWDDLIKSPLVDTTWYPCTSALPSTTATFPDQQRTAIQAVQKALGYTLPGAGGNSVVYDIALMEKDVIEHAGTSGPAMKAYLETYKDKTFTSPDNKYTYTADNHVGNTGSVYVCKAGQLGDLDGAVYDAGLMAKINAATPLTFVPTFGDGAPAYIH
jgi:ABC-type branched-subunit amino acid transport system substrate-binding protein